MPMLPCAPPRCPLVCDNISLVCIAYHQDKARMPLLTLPGSHVRVVAARPRARIALMC